MEDADLVVEAFDESDGDLVVGVAVGFDAVRVGLDHRGKLLEGLEALPFECIAPVFEEVAGPYGSAELAERLLEEICGVESLVDLEEQL